MPIMTLEQAESEKEVIRQKQEQAALLRRLVAAFKGIKRLNIQQKLVTDAEAYASVAEGKKAKRRGV